MTPMTPSLKKSVILLLSFAALSMIPTAVLALYLRLPAAVLGSVSGFLGCMVAIALTRKVHVRQASDGPTYIFWTVVLVSGIAGVTIAHHYLQ